MAPVLVIPVFGQLAATLSLRPGQPWTTSGGLGQKECVPLVGGLFLGVLVRLSGKGLTCWGDREDAQQDGGTSQRACGLPGDNRRVSQPRLAWAQTRRSADPGVEPPDGRCGLRQGIFSS